MDFVLGKNEEPRDAAQCRTVAATRQQRERQLRQSQKMEAIGALAGGIAHDFNNILGTIIGYTSLLEIDVAGQPEAEESVSEILKASLRARDLVRQILAFGRQDDEERGVIALQQVIAEAIQFLRATVPASLKLTARIDPSTRPVLADASQIHQVVMNFTTNAIEAMAEQPGELEISYGPCLVVSEFTARHPGLKPGPHAVLTVADTGPGMDPRTLKRIFEPHFTTKPPGLGTGLGLAVVHGIVKSHAGAVTVTSRAGGGTTFRVYLPTHLAAPTPPAQDPAPPPRGDGQRILMIDDEAALTQVNGQLLERLGYHVSAHNSAQAALASFRAAPDAFHLVLTDLAMPGLDGVRLVRQIHNLRPLLPVILMTAFAGKLGATDASKLGMAELLLKPFTPQTLALAVHKALARFASRAVSSVNLPSI